MPRPPAPPPATPRTTTGLLLARGGDPFEQARISVSSSLTSVEELLGLLPEEQVRLRARFSEIARILRGALVHLPAAGGSGSPAPNVPDALGWGEPTVVAGTPAGSTPVSADPRSEPVYGFRAALDGAHRYLDEAATALRMGAQSWGVQRLTQAGAVAHGASAIDHLASMFTAAVWDFERPPIPPLPGKGGRIELHPSPRATPMGKWARYARCTFHTERVELTTADGRRVIGLDDPIAFLLHVAPPSPTAVLIPYEPREEHATVPLYDELGVVHFCNAAGRSMGAIAVADWLAQPELTVAQGRLAAGAETLRAFARLVWALDAAGITAGAATLRVPVRRGVLHPPHAEPTRLTTTPRAGAAPATGAIAPPVVAEVLRPAPHLVPYSGWAATGQRAFVRRRRRRRAWQIDLGPSSPITEVLRTLYPTAVWIGLLGSGYLLLHRWWIQALVALAVLTVAEPWITWLARQLLDRRRTAALATYRPGRGTQSVQFQFRAALTYDGHSITMRTGTRHEVSVAGPNDADLGVVELRRLTHRGSDWGLALVDRAGRWRLVLPAADWAPGGDLVGLAGFAEAAGLQLGEQEAPPAQIEDDVTVESSRSARARSRGPNTRGMVIAAGHAVIPLLLTLPGSTRATVLGSTIIAIALVPVGLRALWSRWYASHPKERAD